jgi:hypothetical protein
MFAWITIFLLGAVIVITPLYLMLLFKVWKENPND